MSFPTHLRARPGAGRARRRRGRAGAGRTSADLAQVEAHLAAVQSMTANFVQTDAQEPRRCAARCS